MSSFPIFLKEFLEAPFKTLDTLDLKYVGFQFNILKDDIKLRKALFDIFFLIPLIMWVLLGSDSTADQVINLVLNVPNFLLGKITLNQLLEIYNSFYGLGTHWSAAVIYSLLFIGLSKHLREKIGAKNSENLAITTGFVGLTIATFEFFWIGSYYVFQNQHWILSLQFPQLRIIMQNILFALVGVVVLVGFDWSKYKLNIDKITVFCFFASIGLILFWWHYPFPVEHLTVEIAGYGTWVSSQQFPQTMYTVQPTLDVAWGNMYHIEDAGVHFINNITKIFMTLSFYSLFKIKHKQC